MSVSSQIGRLQAHRIKAFDMASTSESEQKQLRFIDPDFITRKAGKVPGQNIGGRLLVSDRLSQTCRESRRRERSPRRRAARAALQARRLERGATLKAPGHG